MSTRQPIDRENGLGSFCIKLQFVDLIQSSNTHNSPTPYCTYSFNVLDLVDALKPFSSFYPLLLFHHIYCVLSS